MVTRQHHHVLQCLTFPVTEAKLGMKKKNKNTEIKSPIMNKKKKKKGKPTLK